MEDKIENISKQIIDFLSCDDPNYRANTMVDCASADELPIVLLGLIDKEETVRAVAADVIGSDPHNFTPARKLLERLYLTEQSDLVKVNLLVTLKKWGSKLIGSENIDQEFQRVMLDKTEDFVSWAKSKFGKIADK